MTSVSLVAASGSACNLRICLSLCVLLAGMPLLCGAQGIVNSSNPFCCAAQISILNACTCRNNATTVSNGQFQETILISGLTGQVWTVTSSTGLYLVSSAAPPAAPTPVPPGTAFTEQPAGSGKYSLPVLHVDALGYTLTATSNTGESLSISNNCAYPNPVISPPLAPAYCAHSIPVSLSGNPGDAVISSASFTINGQPISTLDPVALGLGTYTVVYTVNGGQPKATGPADPGCIQSVSAVTSVVSTPATLICQDTITVSLDTNCIGYITPDQLLEGNYLCPDDYNVELDKTLPFNGLGPWLLPFLSNADVGKLYQARITHLPSGNTCTGMVKVEDKLPPKLSCTNVAIPCVVLDNTPAYLSNTLKITAAFPKVKEECGKVDLTYTDVFFDLDCTSAGNLSARIVRSWTGTDPSGNTGSCIQILEIQRKHLPDVRFPKDVTVNCEAPLIDPSVTGTPYITAFGINFPLYPNNSACELQAMYKDQTFPTCSGGYKIIRTWTVFDWCLPLSANMNPLTYLQSIIVADKTGPALSCPPNITVSTDPNACVATVDLPDVILSDNCSRPASIEADVQTVDENFKITGTLSDFPGNNYWNSDTLGVLGNVSGLPPGLATVTYLASDDCGNLAACQFKILVDDMTPPTPVCLATTKISIGGSGDALLNATALNTGSFDNCGYVTFKARRIDFDNSCQPQSFFRDQVRFCCEDVGDTVMVALRVYDVFVPAGPIVATLEEENSSDCMVRVIVEDKLKPVPACPPNVTVDCENFDPSLWTYGLPKVVDNCCIADTSVQLNYNAFDTVCNKGTILRTFTVADCHSNTATCSQRIVVQYVQDYFIRFPNDVLLNGCDTSGVYGEPTFFDKNCELLAVSYQDMIFTKVPDACYRIERTWKIINWCTYNPNLPLTVVPNPEPNAVINHPANLPGPTISACGTAAPWSPTVTALTPGGATTNFCTYYTPGGNGYEYKQIIKVTDNQAPFVNDCPAGEQPFCDLTPNAKDLWNETYWWDPNLNSHDLCEGPADLSITAGDLCSGSSLSVHYLLFLDLDGDGLQETVINSTQKQQINKVFFGNAANPNYTGGEARAFDQRPVPLTQRYRFALQTQAGGKTVKAAVRWNTALSPSSYTVPELPYGKHRIEWIIEDGCGNEHVCAYDFVVKDCKPPTVVCKSVTVNIMPTQTIEVELNSLLLYGEDNCTPSDRLKFSMRKAGTGTGFPLTQAGQTLGSVIFTCMDLGVRTVEIWSQDLAGNAAYCETTVTIEDNAGNCKALVYADIAGKVLMTEKNEGVENTQVNLTGTHPAVPLISKVDYTDSKGVFEFVKSVPMLGSFTLRPYKDDNPLNGVTTYDLLLLSRHILGLTLFDSPYKWIAADANRSNSVTSFDIIEIRKLILGVYQFLPANTSWRFVPQSFVFPNPNIPFQTLFPEQITIEQVMSNYVNQDFVGIKIGDVNNSAEPNSGMFVQDRTAGIFYFETDDYFLQAGEEQDVTIRTTTIPTACQFTLEMSGLELVDLHPGPGLAADQLAVFSSENAITAAFFDLKNPVAITLRIRAREAGSLQQRLFFSDKITPSAVYSENGDLFIPRLRFKNNIQSAKSGFELFPNQPNPWHDRTAIRFYVPEDGEVVLTVFDPTGRTLLHRSSWFPTGMNNLTLVKQQLNTNGLLYYKLEYAGQQVAGKMMVENH